jgi:hypothetical protein
MGHEGGHTRKSVAVNSAPLISGTPVFLPVNQESPVLLAVKKEIPRYISVVFFFILFLISVYAVNRNLLVKLTPPPQIPMKIVPRLEDIL